MSPLLMDLESLDMKGDNLGVEFGMFDLVAFAFVLFFEPQNGVFYCGAFGRHVFLRHVFICLFCFAAENTATI